MKPFEPLMLKFENPKRANDPELGLIDTVLEERPELIKMLAPDMAAGQKDGDFGRRDTPSVERIVHAAIYKEMKHLDCRTLEYAREDSRIRGQFVKMNLPALKGGVSCKRCIIYEVRSARKLFDCGVCRHFLLALPNVTALKGGVLDPTANKS